MLQSKDVDADIEPYAFLLPENSPEQQKVYIVDTSDLFAALEGESSERRGLERMSLLLDIPTKHLHNAGNDAHVRLTYYLSWILLTVQPVHPRSVKINGIWKSARQSKKRTMAASRQGRHAGRAWPWIKSIF